MVAQRFQAYRCPQCGQPSLFASFVGEGDDADTLQPQRWRFVDARCAGGCDLAPDEVPQGLADGRRRLAP